MSTTLYQRLSQSGSDTKSLVTSAGLEFGLNENQMNQIGMVESGLQPNAKNSKSSATGIYQFTAGTWGEVMAKHGAQYGIPEGTQPTDPAANAILGAAYLSSNRDNFKATYGKDPELTDLYLGHFLGNAGRKRYVDGMNADPNVEAHTLVGKKQARDNKDIFWDKDGRPRTASEVYSLFGNKLGVVETTGSNTVMSDLHTSNVTERELGRLLGGNQADLEAELAASDLRSKSLDIPMASPKPKPFTDTVADYGLNIPQEAEERSFLDETWEAAVANWRLSAYSVKANEIVLAGLHTVAKPLGLDMEWDGEALAVTQAFSDMSPDEMSNYDPRNPFIPTEAMYEKAFEAGIERKWAEYLGTAMTPDEFIQKVQLVSEMQKAEKARDSVGTGAGIAGAVAGAAADPLSYVSTPLRGATWAGRALFAGAEAAGMNVLSEKLTEWATEDAVKADVAGAAIGGFVFGSALRGVSDKFLNGEAATRMRARQESMALGRDDMTARPDVEIPEGKTYADHPNEEGAVVDALGNTHSKTSLGNPKTIEAAEAEEIRANRGIDLGPASMLAQSLLRSKSNDTRAIAADLVRAPTGIQGGGTGKAKMTAEDILSRIEGQDNMWYIKAMKQRDALVDTKGIGKEAMQREIVTAIESGDLSKLSPEQRAFAESVTELYTRKFDEATNVGRFGNPDAPPVFASRRDPSKYVPQVFEEGKVLAAKARFGGEEGWEGLQEAIKRNWLAQWRADHNGVQARFKADYADELAARSADGKDPQKVLEDMVKEYIEKKSYGISRNGDFTHSSGLEDANLSDSLVGIENNNFTLERNMFDSGFKAMAQDGDEFAINDLRHFDLMNIAQMYNRRINGDVAIHGSTGKDTKALKDRIVALPDGPDRHQLDQLTRLITGRARVDNTMPAFNAAMRGLQNGSMWSNMAMMWTNNLSELSGWASNRTNFVLRNGVKGLNQLMNPQSKFTKADMDDFRHGLFGYELNTILTKSFANTRDYLKERGTGNVTANIAAGLDQVGAVITNQKWNPYAKLLNKTQESLVGLARSGALGDITQEAFGGIKFRPEILKNASVTPAQYKGVLDMLRTHVKDVDGQLKPDVKSIVSDPRSNDLWRLVDYIASDSVTRTGRVGMNYVGQPNALMNLALQFKSFTLKGLNAKTVRLFHESFHGKSIDNAVRMAISVGLMSGLYAMQTHYKSLGIPESERQAYLDRMLEPEMIAYQSVARGAELGPLLGGAGIVLGAVTGEDMFRAARSTVDPRSVGLPKDPLKSEASMVQDKVSSVGKGVTDTVPAARTYAGLAAMLDGAVGVATAPQGYQRDMEKKAFFDGLATFSPNAPEIQFLINAWAEQAGAAGKNTY
ncbi:internal virion protein [Aeromonas phage JELG-KS1]|uniref:Internal virion protein n=1 Tax=Aeromonas phage JELG-KS1 TaxID=2951233 RepID=A0A9E7NKS4_9CAUD|nr:internal virion protein [Aeromonas phage JELG-KS1]